MKTVVKRINSQCMIDGCAACACYAVWKRKGKRLLGQAVCYHHHKMISHKQWGYRNYLTSFFPCKAGKKWIEDCV